MAVQPVPPGYHTVTPHLTIRNCREAIAFYEKAFGATTLSVMPGPDGKIMHGEIKIGDSVVMVADEFLDWGARSPQALGGTPGGLFLYVDDADAWFQRAVDAGATVEMPLENQFWGDRYGKLRDPFGHGWAIGQHIEDVGEEEMMRRMQASMGGGQ